MDKKIGQHFTSKAESVVLTDEIKAFCKRHVAPGKVVLEPFAGNLDLTKWLHPSVVVGYDIDSSLASDEVSVRNTLIDPPAEVHHDFLITNPPWLATNKASQDVKRLCALYGVDDLYKAAMVMIAKRLPTKAPGVLILPAGVFSPGNEGVLKTFLSEFAIVHAVIHEGAVFDTTDYPTAVIAFEPACGGSDDFSVVFTPSGRLVHSVMKAIHPPAEWRRLAACCVVSRATKLTPEADLIQGSGRSGSFIVIRCLDGPIGKPQCGAVVSKEPYVDRTDRLSSRMFMTPVFSPPVAYDPDAVAARFNKALLDARDATGSLFMTNYREGTRRRLSFAVAMSLIKFCVSVRDTYSG